MRKHDRVGRELALGQRALVTRQQLMAKGLSKDGAQRRVQSGQWKAVQAGVYKIDDRPDSWEEYLLAAALAAGQGAVASHRAAMVLWGLDGISSAPIELTVPYEHRPVPEGTVVHRTRRAIEGDLRNGIPVTPIERTILDGCSVLGDLTMTKALESALRRRYTTVDDLLAALRQCGGRGVKGTRRLRRILAQRVNDTPTGSGSETEALFHMRRYGVPEPALQREFETSIGRIRPDFYWPERNKAVEIDGIDAHDSADKLDHDLRRQNAMLDLGIELRRFSARQVRREPKKVMTEIRQFLGLSEASDAFL